MTVPTHRAATSRRWHRPVALIIAVAVLGIIAASTAHAAWTARVSATGSVTAGKLTSTLTGATDTVLRSSESSTRSVTLTNTTVGTSTQAAAVSVNFKASSGDATLAQGAQLRVWPTADTASCTATAVMGPDGKAATWSVGLTMATSLTRGAKVSYCVQTKATNAVASATGARALVGTATATMSVGSFQTSQQASANVSTVAIYPYSVPANAWYRVKPSGQSICLDVSGGGNAKPGAVVGTYTCYTTNDVIYSNQWFNMKTYNDGDDFALLSTNLPANTSLQASGTGVVVQNTNSSVEAQKWIPQLVAANTYQFVSRSTGLCMTAPASAGNLTLTQCNNLTTQKFTLTKVDVAVPAADPVFDMMSDDGAWSMSDFLPADDAPSAAQAGVASAAQDASTDLAGSSSGPAPQANDGSAAPSPEPTAATMPTDAVQAGQDPDVHE